MSNYSLGLDIGTNSIGWAVVDENNQLVKKNGFTFWGVRMFDDAKTAAERRGFRSSRRRIARRKKRIVLLQKEFNEEINKIDPNFFQRINDSFLKQEDKMLNNHYTYFDDAITDKDYFKKFPTIFHLRKFLMESDEKADIRMLYLACHHIIKYRGHFLNEGQKFEKSDVSSIINSFNSINDGLKELNSYDEEHDSYFELINENQIDSDFTNKFIDIYNSNKTKNDKTNELCNLFKVNKKTLAYELIIPLILTGKKDISKLSLVKEMKYEKCEIDLSSEELEKKIEEARGTIPEFNSFYDKILDIKIIVDYLYLVDLLGDSNTLSDSMVKQYEEHNKQLKEFKLFIKTYARNKYFECFRKVEKDLNNYPKYIGMNSCNSQNEKKKSIKRFGHCSKENFYLYVKKLLDNIKDEEAKQKKEYFLSLIDKGQLLSRQNSGQNTVIPMQLNFNELEIILNKQEKFYPFLNISDGKYTAKERIELIFSYHIPYYVGPLGKTEKGWLIKKDDNAVITPFNYQEVIDMDETAKEFIQRMQNKCTYLHGVDDYCLPKSSLLFSEYTCLSYLNKIKINGSLITKDLKDELFNNVFLSKQKPSKKDIINYLKTHYNFDIDVDSSIPEVTCNMSSYITFKNIFGPEFEANYDTIEAIIKDITIFEDKKILERRLQEIYHLDEDKAKAIKGLNYSGYGALSRKLLTKLKPKDEETGEIYDSIIQIMRDTNLNLQEILFNKDFKFMDLIDKYNKEQLNEEAEDFRDYIEENIYVSPMMKRSLIQSYIIIEELERILKQKISKYYVECARTNKARKEETKSRANKTLELYKKCIEEATDFAKYHIDINGLQNKLNELEQNPNQGLSDKIYLYFTQLGKCMYTGKQINFDEVLSGKYDIDHIYPQSLIKDDSFSNRVLVDKNYNQNTKKDKFLFEIQDDRLEKMEPFYRLLLSKNLITKEKYRRLTQKEMAVNELDGFVNRQIVSTNQAVKGLIQLLKLYKNVGDNDIIYSKADIISDFRHKYDQYLEDKKLKDEEELKNNIHYDFEKSRDANNYHHAHDAYLNVVIGRAINDYYHYNRFKDVKDLYDLKSKNISINPLTILSKDRKMIVNGKEVIIWNRKKTLALLNKNIKERFDIHETTKTSSSGTMFSKVTINPANNGTVMAKSNLPIEKYGGITSYSYCMYCILKMIDKKDKVSYVLEAIPGAFRNNLKLYLDKTIDIKKYKSYEIINDKIKTNCVIEYESLKYCVTGKTGNQYLIKNLIDRNFDYDFIKTIKKITKYFDNIKDNIEMEFVNNKVIISKNLKNKSTIELSINECYLLFDELIKKYEKSIYNYSFTKSIKENEDKFYNLDFKKKIEVIHEMLTLLKTNERGSANLEFIGLSKNSGALRIGKALKPGMKFVSESITGYYRKLLFEVPSGI